MSPLTGRATLLALAAIAGACRYRPTQVTLLVDSNIAADRTMALTVTVLEGPRSRDELVAASAGARVLRAPGALVLPSSLALVPKGGGARDAMLSLRAVLDVEASASQPALRVERVQRLSLLERTPQQARVFFNVACASAAEGCLRAAASECTVSQRCLEQGLTCGDDGACVALELVTTPVPADVALDATVVDATRPSFDATAASDAPAPMVSPPRLRRPMSQSTIASSTPAFHWSLPAEASAVVVRVCRQRDCAPSSVIAALQTSGTTLTAPMALSRGLYFWRVEATVRGVLTQSATWQFWVASSTGAAQVARTSPVDVNCDGREDLIVAAPGNNRFYAYLSSPSGALPATPTQTVGFRDGSYLSVSLASAGDVNGDGCTDVIAGGPLDSARGARAGIAAVFLGGPAGLQSTPAWQILGDGAGDELGASVASAGDVNGDGFGDVIVGAPGHREADARRGVGFVRLYLGGPAGLGGDAVQTIYPEAQTFYGAALALLGDVDGDGFSEVSLGDPRNGAAGLESAGAVFIAGGEGSPFLRLKQTVRGAAAYDEFGASVTSLGDRDGDGAWEWAAAAPGARNLGGGTGAVSIFAGGSLASAPSPVSTLRTGRSEARFGAAVRCANIHSDGRCGLIVGAPNEANGMGVRAGSAALFECASTVCEATPREQWYGAAQGELFGSSVETLDVDGDSQSDVIVGAPLFGEVMGGGAVPRGRVTIWLRTGAGFAGMPSSTREGAGSTDEFARAIAR